MEETYTEAANAALRDIRIMMISNMAVTWVSVWMGSAVFLAMNGFGPWILLVGFFMSSSAYWWVRAAVKTAVWNVTYHIAQVHETERLERKSMDLITGISSDDFVQITAEGLDALAREEAA